MDFKKNKTYSNNKIFSNSKNILFKGQFLGGIHKIITENNVFLMLKKGAYKGGKFIYYKCIK